MSLSETQEILSVLQEIMAILERADLKIDETTEKVSGKSSTRGYSYFGDEPGSLRRGMRDLNYYTIAIQEFTGTDTLSQIANRLQTAAQIAIRFKMLLQSIQVIQMAQKMGNAFSPWGAVDLGANAIGFGLSLTTLGQ